MISDIIAAQHKNMDFLLSLVDLLAGGVFWKPEFDDIRDPYLIEKDKLLEVSIDNTSYYDRFAISYSDPLVPSGQVATNTVEKKEKDILILVYPSGRMSFRRSRDSDVNLSGLARIFGGGGHPYAAGANFGRQVTEKSIDAAKKQIADRVEQWLLKRSTMILP